MASESINGRFQANNSGQGKTTSVLPYLRFIGQPIPQSSYQDQRRVLLIVDDTLLGIGLVTLFKEMGLNILSLLEVDKTVILKTVHSFHPDVIVLIETASSIRVGALMSFLSDRSDLRLICVNHEDNYVKIYELHQQPLRQISDFMSIINNVSLTSDPHNSYDPK